jgi:hypothetical protein
MFVLLFRIAFANGISDELEVNMSSTESKTNKLKSILWVILIGALGSGLWEVILKDAVFYMGGLLVEFISSFYDGYFDYLYKNVGKQIDMINQIPGITIFVAILFMPIFFIIKINNIIRGLELNPTEITESEHTEKSLITPILRNHRAFVNVLTIIFLINSMVYTSILIATISTNKAVNVVTRNLEIVRPYISENEYFLLVSRFRLVDNQEKMQTLLDDIEKVSDRNAIKLPEYSLYGIEVK